MDRLFTELRLSTAIPLAFFNINSFLGWSFFMSATLLCACTSTPTESQLSILKADQKKYATFYQQSFQDLKQKSIQVKATAANTDTVLLQTIAKFDSKVNAYEERTTKSIERLNTLIQRLESGEITEEEMKSVSSQYKGDFQNTEDAIKQLNEYVSELSNSK